MTGCMPGDLKHMRGVSAVGQSICTWIILTHRALGPPLCVRKRTTQRKRAYTLLLGTCSLQTSRTPVTSCWLRVTHYSRMPSAR